MKFYFIDRGQTVPLFLTSHTKEDAVAERVRMSNTLDTKGILVEFTVTDPESFAYEVFALDCDMIEAMMMWYTEEENLSFGYFEQLETPPKFLGDGMKDIEVSRENAPRVREELECLLRAYDWNKEADDTHIKGDGICIGGDANIWICNGDYVMYSAEDTGAMVKLSNGEFVSIQKEYISIFSFDGEDYHDSFYLEKNKETADEK